MCDSDIARPARATFSGIRRPNFVDAQLGGTRLTFGYENLKPSRCSITTEVADAARRAAPAGRPGSRRRHDEPANPLANSKMGIGEFFDQETLNGRAIFVRFVISDITANSCCFEQAFSDDGGKT